MGWHAVNINQMQTKLQIGLEIALVSAVSLKCSNKNQATMCSLF